jgi:hypothetical protein
MGSTTDQAEQKKPAPTKSVESAGSQAVETRRANYNRLVRTARLRSIVLENVQFKISPEVLAAENKALLKRDLEVKSKVLTTGSEDGTCIANIVWTIDSKLNKRKVIKCTASYMIAYEGTHNCSEETVTTFIENVGKVATYAYLRGLYASLDWAANLGSQPLPIIQFLPKI